MQKQPPLEVDFQRAVLKKLRQLKNSWWIRVNDPRTVGTPDVLGTVAGVFIAIELKTRSKVTAIQAYTLRKIGETGAEAYVVTPDNLKEVYGFLEKLAMLGPNRPNEV